jgi:hypothetical protein
MQWIKLVNILFAIAIVASAAPIIPNRGTPRTNDNPLLSNSLAPKNHPTTPGDIQEKPLQELHMRYLEEGLEEIGLGSDAMVRLTQMINNHLSVFSRLMGRLSPKSREKKAAHIIEEIISMEHRMTRNSNSGAVFHAREKYPYGSWSLDLKDMFEAMNKMDGGHRE